jgi:hypothetical protein
MATNNNGMYATKGDIKFFRTDIGFISSHEILNFLHNQLGFPVEARFIRYDGPANVQQFTENMQKQNNMGRSADNAISEYSYIRMDIALRPEHILANRNTDNFADRLLFESGAGYKFKDSFVREIEPYQYPKNLSRIMYNPKAWERLRKRGVTRDLIEKIEYLRDPRYSQRNDVFYMSIAVENIIAKMMEDPIENKVKGTWAIIAVIGQTQESLRFMVRANRDTDEDAMTGISWRTIFDDIQ